MARLFGYARVSTTDQDLTLQREALVKVGVKRDLIFEEKASGMKREGRGQLDVIMKFSNRGDTIVVTRIDRLARSMRDLQNIVHELQSKGVAIKATEQPIDTGTAAGKAFLDMLGVFAEFETNLRRERQAEGIAGAKKRGVYTGGKKRIERDRVIALHGEDKGPSAIAKELGISRRQVYRILEEAKGPSLAPSLSD